jgi:DNA-directed RNA polymerase subunit N (RpoN/RPB10)
MPPIKGKASRPRPLRCYNCGNRKVHVERGGNTRHIHGKKKIVANVVCHSCGNEWYSYHPQAIKAMRAADAKGKALAVVDGEQVEFD